MTQERPDDVPSNPVQVPAHEKNYRVVIPTPPTENVFQISQASLTLLVFVGLGVFAMVTVMFGRFTESFRASSIVYNEITVIADDGACSVMLDVDDDKDDEIAELQQRNSALRIKIAQMEAYLYVREQQLRNAERGHPRFMPDPPMFRSPIPQTVFGCTELLLEPPFETE